MNDLTKLIVINVLCAYLIIIFINVKEHLSPSFGIVPP